MAKRDTRLESGIATIPNRRMQLEETPWVVRGARAARRSRTDLVKVLDPKIAKATREEALAKLPKAQTSLGGVPVVAGRAALALHDPVHRLRDVQGRASSAWTCRRRW